LFICRSVAEKKSKNEASRSTLSEAFSHKMSYVEGIADFERFALRKAVQSQKSDAAADIKQLATIAKKEKKPTDVQKKFSATANRTANKQKTFL